MARLACILLSLLLAPGCLYIGGLNHAPEVEGIEGPTRSPRCKQVTLSAKATDPDQDSLSYFWTVTVEAAEPLATGPYVVAPTHGASWCGDETLLDLANGEAPVLSTSDTLVLQPPVRGRYLVRLVVEDPDGARRTREHTFEAPNQPPVVSDLVIERDPAAVDDRVPDLDGRNPVHAHYLAWARQATDYENDLHCGSAASASWEILEPAGVTPRYREVPPCGPGEPADARLYFRLPSEAAASGEVKLRIRVSFDDGHGGKSSREVSETLHPNRPPCIQGPGAQPAIGVALVQKAVPVLHEEGRRFDASQVLDDVPQGLSYTWLIRDQGSQIFSVVQGQSGAVLQLPPWFRPVGHQLELRVSVAELDLEAPPCSEDEPLCRLPQSFDPKQELTSCYTWVTWRVTFI